MMKHLVAFLLTFVLMEFAAWFLHRYVMHGFLWSLHEDHHVPRRGHVFQRNDSFAIVFAVPSFLFIFLNNFFYVPYMATVGYGIMVYGMVYFFVHEVIIHRRMRFLHMDHWYFRALVKAHTAHHAVTKKEGCCNFGMLCVPLRYFREARTEALRKKARTAS